MYITSARRSYELADHYRARGVRMVLEALLSGFGTLRSRRRPSVPTTTVATAAAATEAPAVSEVVPALVGRRVAD